VPDLGRFTRPRHFILRVSAIFVLFNPVLAICGYVFPATQHENATGKISGRVCRADTGVPIAMATVTLSSVTIVDDANVPLRQSVRTSADGTYVFAGLTVGAYSIRAQRHGFASRNFGRPSTGPNAQKIAVSEGLALENIDIELIAGGAISGTVLDDDGQPLEDAEVSAIRLTYHRGGQTEEVQVGTIRSDDLGGFRLFDLPPGEYFVRAANSHESFADANIKPHDLSPAFRSTYYPGAPTLAGAQKVIVRPGSETAGVRFSIGKQFTYSISGKIIDPSAGTVPKRYFIGPWYLGGGMLTLSTSAPNSDGSFLIRGAPSGEYVLWAFALLTGPATHSEQTQQFSSGGSIIVVSNDNVHADIQIGHRSEVGGTAQIENSNGKSASGIGITLLPELTKKIFNPFNSIFDSTTEQKGKFQIGTVEAGQYSFSLYGKTELYIKKVVCNKTDYTYRPFTVGAGESFDDCILTLANDTSRLVGQVLDDGRPVADRIVVAIPTSPSLRELARYTFTATTNKLGEYKLSGVIPGDYYLFAVPPDDAEPYFDINFGERNQRDAERVTIKPSETKTVQLKPTTPQ